jgi:hypothetical protein
MKKIYLSVVGLSCVLISNAQVGKSTYSFGEKSIETPALAPKDIAEDGKKETSTAVEKGITYLWSEDFTGTGFNTSNGQWIESTAPDSAYWNVQSTHPMSSYNYNEALNGNFLAWNSFTPIYALEQGVTGGFAKNTVTGAVTSPKINLSSVTNGLAIQFKTEAMYCCNNQEFPFMLAVSNNNGTTWSNPIPVDLGVDRNVWTKDIAQPMNITMDLSQYFSSYSDTCRIQFIWKGNTSDNNGQYNSHYFWLIDDIKLYELPNYNLSAQNAWIGDIDADYEYTAIPSNFAGTLTVQAKVRNIGKLAPVNPKLSVQVKGTNVDITEVGGTWKNDFNLEYDTVTFASTIDLSQLAVGTYTINYKVVADSVDADTLDNKFLRTFQITNGIYGQRNYEQPLYYGSIGKDEGATATESKAMGVGSVFTVPEDAELQGVNLKIGKSTSYPTTVGGQLYVQLYVYDPTASTFNNAHVYEAGDWTFTITSAMVPTSGSKDVTLNFHNSESSTPVPTLLAGQSYIALINHDGGSANHFCYLENPFDDDNSTHTYGDFSSTNPGNNWFSLGTQVISELNFNPALAGLEEQEAVRFGFIAPNPTSGATTINYSLTQAGPVAIEVVDVTGKVVYAIDKGTLEAGSHLETIDASAFNSGVYFVKIAADNTVSTRKFTKK